MDVIGAQAATLSVTAYSVSMTGSADESLNSAQIGETVRWHRQANQLTQAQLGERMAQAGFPWHKSTVSKTESGQRDTTVRELIALARIFEVSASALVSMPATALHYQESLQTQATEMRAEAVRLDIRAADAAHRADLASKQLDNLEQQSVILRQLMEQDRELEKQSRALAARLRRDAEEAEKAIEDEGDQ